MYPPNDYSGGYPPNDYSSGYPPSDYSSGYPPDSTSRSLNNNNNNSSCSNGRPPRPDRKYSYSNNPSVGAGPMSTQMPGFPGGGAPFGGPGGYPPDDVGGFSIPSMGGGYPPNGPPGYGGYPPQGPGFGGPGFGSPGFGGPGGPGGYPPQGPPFGGPPGGNFGGYPPVSGPPGGGFGYPPGGNGGYPPANNGPGGYPPANNSRPPFPPRNNNNPPPNNNLGPRPNQANNGPRPQQPPRPNAGASGNQQRPPPIQAQATSGPAPSQYRPQGQQQQGPPPPQQGLNWRPVTKQNPEIPHDAIRAGTYHDEPFYIGRSSYKGGMQVGMVSKKQGGLVVTYDGKPVLFHDFEVLCGPVAMVKWVSVDGRLELAKMKHGRPYPCGNEKDGTLLYAGRTTHKDCEYGGKVSEKINGMLFPQNGKEKRTKEYLVLCSL